MATWDWALTFQPKDKDGGADPAAVPVSDVLGASITYGKSGDALSYAGGSMTLQLDNSSAKYTPLGGGTYSNARFLGIEVSLKVDVTGAGAPSWTHGAPAAFTGVVTDVQWTFDNRFQSTMTITVSDALTALGTLSFQDVSSGAGLSISAGSASAALTAVLATANGISSQINQTTILNPSGDAGQNMQAVSNYTGTAGALLQIIEQSDGGDVYVRHGLPVDSTNDYNAVTFRTRGQATISDAVTGVTGLYPLNLWDSSLSASGDEPHYFQNISFASGVQIAYSQVSFTSEGGTEQKVASDSTIVNEVGARVITRTGLLAENDAATLNLANAFLNQYGVSLAPPLATRGIQMPPIVPGENDGYQLVKYSVGDACSIRLRPANAAATVEIFGVISGVSWNITPQSATMTVQLEDGDQTVFFILDSGDFGVLDVNRLA